MGFNDIVVPHYTYTLHMHWHFVVFSVIPRWQCKRFDHEAQTTVWLYNNNHNITWYQYEYMIFFYYISSVELPLHVMNIQAKKKQHSPSKQRQNSWRNNDNKRISLNALGKKPHPRNVCLCNALLHFGFTIVNRDYFC